MPNRPCIAHTHFERTDRRCNKANFFHQCRHCLAAARRIVRDGRRPIDIKDIHARQSTLEVHLSSCKYVPAWAIPGSAGFRPFSAEDSTRVSSSFPSAEQSEILDYFVQRFGVDELEEFERLLVEFQADNQRPDTFIARASTKRLFAFLNKLSVASLPSRQVFGGRILDKFAKEAFHDNEAGLRHAAYLSGGRVNFLSDVWMNISKMHLLGCQLSLYGVVCGLGLFPTSDLHDGLAIAEHLEKIMIDAERRGWVIGAVVADDAGQCARARRILALRWAKVTFLRCFAHSINNIVKAVLRTAFRDVTTQASAVVTCLNSSSFKWLKRADDAMVHAYGAGGVRRLLPLCDTRWNSMQASFASLLRVRPALRVFEAENREDDSYPEGLKVLNDNNFLENLKEAGEVIRPLCFAPFMLQHDNNTLSDVTFCFRQVYDSFVTSSYSEKLIEIIEKRWADCEKPLFLLAYVLDPRRQEVVNELPVDVVDKLRDFALLYYRKVFDADSSSIKGEMSEWVNGKYTEGKSMNDFQHLATPPLAALFQNIRADKSRRNLGVSLCDLALAVFAMTVNTATCERYFSELALIHTAHRNK